MSQERVVIVGASNNPERYSHRTLLLLRKHGHEVVLCIRSWRRSKARQSLQTSV